MRTVPLYRWQACIICAAIACASIFVSSPALANSLPSELWASSSTTSPTICLATSNTSTCLAVVAVANSNTKQDQISKFLKKLWKVNAVSGPPILGFYELQRCANPGPAPYLITCVLWSSASHHNASQLSQEFKSSQLFQIINTTSFGHSTATSKAEFEFYACLQISVPPLPGPGAFEAISLPDSTLSALSRSGSVALESAARDFSAAAREQSFLAMRSALVKGVTACHRLGLQTAK
jgi:phosphoglycerol transferase MdoB-like AlkP superfamily enzyme